MTRHLNKGSLLLLLLLLTIAGATTWLRTHHDIAGPVADTDRMQQQIDFFMKNFRIRQYDDQGQLHYTLKGTQLNHFQQDEHTEISNPDMELHPQNKHWTLQADQAVTVDADKEAAEEIRFLGNVRVEQADSMLIRTEALLLKPETEYMETLEPVTISGTEGNIHAESLHADLRTGIHTLTAVKGRYAP
jgi:lipopolysaccharide export system protein LptC